MARRGTYSIVARDPATGEIGVAVQSHWFSVGPIVPWARPGVGAVATQSIGDLDTALRRVRRAIELQPGWRGLLDQLTPDITPGAPAVRPALRD